MDILSYKDQLSYKEADRSKDILIYSLLRKKWIVCTREELCRQCFVLFLHKVHAYPLELMVEERGIKVGNHPKRFDLMVYDRNGMPFLLVEIKSPSIPLSINTLLQSMAYQSSALSQYLCITNGHQVFTWEQDQATKKMKLIDELPSYDALK